MPDYELTVKYKTYNMPFAGYENFAACVKANGEKKNPSAYCGSVMHATEGKDYSLEEDRSIGSYGETNYADQTVTINPGMGDVVNTIIHEKLHVQYPDMPHDEVYRKAFEIESSMGIKEMGDMLQETAKEINKGRLVRTVVSKVIKSNVK